MTSNVGSTLHVSDDAAENSEILTELHEVKRTCHRLHRPTDMQLLLLDMFSPLMPIVAIGTAINDPVLDRVKPSFVIFNIRAL